MNINEDMRAENADELELLALEISEFKNVLREMSQQASRIERRVKAALPSSRQTTKAARRSPMDETAARRMVDRLTERAKGGEQIESELRRMTVKKELAILARSLGMTNTRLPPKDDLVRRISTRLRQRASVVSGIHGSLQEGGRRTGL